MPRARISNASLIAGADALILPWLAPSAFVASSGLRRRRRHARSSAAQKEKEEIRDDERSCLHWQLSLGTARATQSTPYTLSTTPASASYAQIASFARQHVRGYATSTSSSGQASDEGPHVGHIASAGTDGSRYSRRRTWKEDLAKQLEDLTPESAGRRRVKHIALAEERLERQVRRLQRDRGRFENKLLYDGQYRSLRRFILNLKRWRETKEDVRKGQAIDPDDEHWLLRTFAALDRSTYARVSALTNPVTLIHGAKCRLSTARVLEGNDLKGGGQPYHSSPEQIWDNWQTFGENKEFYESYLVCMLDRKPGYAQDFVTVLANDAFVPDSKFVILADALAHLAKLHVKGEYPPDQGWEATPEANAGKFISTFLLFTRTLADTSVYSQDLLHSLVLLADGEDLKRIYDALVESKTRLARGTSLHFANAFGEAGEFRYALQCLDRFLATKDETTRKLIVESESFRWTCAAILRGSMRAGKNYHETPGIVAAFAQNGLKMDLLLYDVVMHNAMDAGDFATAFKVYNALEGNGLKPDKYTFSILLHGCTVQNDPAMFKGYAEYCAEKAKELEDPWLATDYLYYVYICDQNKPAAERDPGLLWRTYLDLFDLTPLKPVLRHGSRTMKDAVDQHTAEPETQKLAPTPMALYLMLQTEIQTAQTLNVHYTARLYDSFKKAVLREQCHPTLTRLADSPVIWNSFLHAFCTKMQYASASQVIKDMTARGPQPNVYSWNMFMQSFFKTGQVQAAERVFELMRSRGVDPDRYTYGVMVRGYARAQLVDRIGEPMQHLSHDDQLDPDLLRALGTMQARQDLTAALEKSRLDKERKEAEEAARHAAAEKRRLDPPRFASLLTKALRFRPETHWDNGDADDAMEDDELPAGVEDGEPQGRIELEEINSPPEEPQSNASKLDPVFRSLLGTKGAGVAAKGLPKFTSAREMLDKRRGGE